LAADLSTPGERARLARLLREGLAKPVGFVLPLKVASDDPKESSAVVWESSPWPLRREHLYALPGDSPLGLRLPLGSLPDVLADEIEHDPPGDPFAPQAPLRRRIRLRLKPRCPGETISGASVREGRGAPSRARW